MNKIKTIDFLMAYVIFIVTILEFISWRLSLGETATITNVGNNYLVYYQPLISSIIQLVFALFFFNEDNVFY